MAAEGSVPGTVAELFATLGLDASKLDAGLAASVVKIQLSAAEMNKSLQTVGAMWEAVSGGKLMQQEAITAFLETLKTSSKGANDQVMALIQTLQRMQAAQSTAGGQSSIERMMAAEQARMNTFESQMDAEQLQRSQKHEGMWEAEQARKIADESRADSELLTLRQKHDSMMEAEDTRRITDETRLDAERLNQQQRANREQEREQARHIKMMEDEDRRRIDHQTRLDSESQRRRDELNPRSQPQWVRAFLAGMDIQAVNQLLGFQIPWGISRIMATLPAVQVAMEAAFPILLIAGFLDILKQVHERMAALTDEMNGWGEANRKAWGDARLRAIDSMHDLVKYQDQLRRVEETGMEPAPKKAAALTNIDTTITASEEQRRLQVQSLNHMAKQEQDLKLLRELTYDSVKGLSPAGAVGGFAQLKLMESSIEREYGSMDNFTAALEKVRGSLETWNKDIGQLRLERRRVELEDIKDRSDSRRRRDPITELPNIIPWFMGARSSDAFMSAMNQAPLTPPTGGTGRFMPLMPMRPAAMMTSPAPVMTPTNAISPVRAQSQGGSINISPVYAPVFKFDGIPADVERFVRDKMEPALVRDLKDNFSGFRKTVAEQLRREGL